MKNIGKRLTLVFVIMAINISCHKEEQKKINLLCDYATGDTTKSQVGRIYKWSDSATTSYSFYYIGNPDPNLRGSGFVPCNGFPEDLKPESEIGVLVIYSGIVKLGRDAEEPLYFGIELTEIKKAD